MIIANAPTGLAKDHSAHRTVVMNSTHPGNQPRTITVVILSEAKDLPECPTSSSFDVGFNVTTERVPQF